MRLTYIILAVVFIFTACKKDKTEVSEPVGTADTSDTTKQPIVVKDSSIYITGLDSVIEIGNYDSLLIPITIGRDTGSLGMVSLSVSDLEGRIYLKLGQLQGNLPLTTTIKINTYITPSVYLDTFYITLTTTGGKEHKFLYHLKNSNLLSIYPIIYNTYLKNQALKVTDINGNPVYAPNINLNYDPNTTIFYFTGIPLGQGASGLQYQSIDNFSDPIANLYASGYYGGGQVHMELGKNASIKGTNGVDTMEFKQPFMSPPTFNFYLPYHATEDPLSEWIVIYTTVNPITEQENTYLIKGKFKFD